MNKQHYYLMAGQVRYEVKGESFTVNLNTLLQNEDQRVIMKDIGQTQQAMQVRFFREVMAPSPDVIVKDVFIQAVSYLGHMTEEEFNAKPEPLPSDTKPEDKPAQDTVEGGTPASAPTPLPGAETARPPAPETSNEADKD